ncbi:acetyltransferase-like isoleucine patch superfamily enzyme [Rhodopirellula rubra]|uniref:Acetyltransferase-like isoleucine patch superfamily enzyme n=1 Tax=Aporhodopirellula rubra TaxID=980271 RepID=A0A7W5DY26_9BACT|nr:acetyltransferase-like isoleucine patch superfamily enzyme [Aporhodopirellula rubra]
MTERVTIGNRVLIGPHSFITDHNHQLNGIGPISLQGCESNPVSIGDDVWIGTGATILPGVKVGTGAVIAAGAVVTHDVDDLDIVGGVPARHIRSRRDADLASDNTEVEQNQEAK